MKCRGLGCERDTQNSLCGKCGDTLDAAVIVLTCVAMSGLIIVLAKVGRML
jgi:hypothetical protein